MMQSVERTFAGRRLRIETGRMDDFVAKPIRPADLLRVLELARRRNTA